MDGELAFAYLRKLFPPVTSHPQQGLFNAAAGGPACQQRELPHSEPVGFSVVKRLSSQARAHEQWLSPLATSVPREL